MGVFQSGINNILLQTGVASKVLSDKIKNDKLEKEAKIKEQETQAENEKLALIKSQEAKAKAEEEAKIKEQESIAKTKQLINDALSMSLGYKDKDIKAEKAGQAMGLKQTRFSKKPTGISEKTYDRRLANMKAQEQILLQYIQNEDFRNRMSKFSVKDLSQALNPVVRSKKKIGGDINGKKK